MIEKAEESFAGPARFAFWRVYKFSCSYCADLVIGAEVLAALYLFNWLLRLGQSAGISEEHLAAFELLHFWSSLAVIFWLSVDFIRKFVLTTLSEKLK
jgi:hypothetical protein